MTLIVGGRNLTHQVSYQLGAAIVQGEYQVGGLFPTEAQMCADFQMSRSVVREAVKMLAAKGLISSRPRQGIRVLPKSQWNLFDSDVLAWTLLAKPSLNLVREFIQLRKAIEPPASELAACLQNMPDLDDIKYALARIKHAEVGEDDPLESNIAFHLSILAASGNRFFIQHKGAVRCAITVSFTAGKHTNGASLTTFNDGQEIYELIRKGAAKAAGDRLQLLFEKSLFVMEDSEEVESLVVAS